MMSRVLRTRFAPIALAALLVLGSAAPAAARPAPAKPAKVEIGRAVLGAPAGGHPVVLVPVTYPIQLSGRWVPFRVTLLDGQGRAVEDLEASVRLSAGRLRSPDRRRRFTFVHRFDLRGRQAGDIRPGQRVRVSVRGRLDLDRDGEPELGSRDRSTRPLGTAKGSLCSTLPLARPDPGRRMTLSLPACTSPRRWRVVRQPDHGSARVREGNLVYRSQTGFRGVDSLLLTGGQRVRLAVGASGGAVVRALGDSVTAGFGYYASGEQMGFSELDDCRPAAKEFNDACSSNSLGETSEPGPVKYAPDYGLAKNVSWAAQWANEYGVTNFKNFAISGSEPANWAPGGEFYASTTRQIENEDPDYILLTLGANPLLSNVLFGEENMECAVFGNFPECIAAEFAKVELRKDLKNLYLDLVEKTSATIYLMQYHLSVPWSALAYSSTQIAEMGQFLNREIASVAAEVSPGRLRVVTPPHFNVGIDISPVYPSRYTCRVYPVDGPSVQSTGTQDELEDHVLSFCSGPASGPPWVINGDTGIHPSAAGYTQMASQAPPPTS
jgi:lysophospholipase L1-like esterase